MTRLKELRKLHGRTQAEIAYVIGITRAAYTNIENGKRQPDYETLNKLADYFNVSVDYLLGRDESIKKEPATNNGDGLDDEKLKLLVDLFQAAPEYLQDAALAVLRSEAARQQDKDKP